MSWDATAWAKGVTAGGPGPKAVLLCLADRADEEWSCFPSQKLLAVETEQSVRTVQRQLLGLEADGLIKRVHRAREDGNGRASDRYVLLGRDDNLSGDNLSSKGSLTRQDDGGLSDTAVVGGTPKEHPEEEQEPILVDPPAAKSVDAFFDEFWEAYPRGRRVGKKACLAKFRTAVKNGTKPQVIIDAAKALDAYYQREQKPLEWQKTSLPWLNGGHWEDELVGLRAKVRPIEESYSFSEGVVRVPTW